MVRETDGVITMLVSVDERKTYEIGTAATEAHPILGMSWYDKVRTQYVGLLPSSLRLIQRCSQNWGPEGKRSLALCLYDPTICPSSSNQVRRNRYCFREKYAYLGV